MEPGDISVESIQHCRADLARLYGQLRQLNFFRATGVARSELPHSNFLKFLLTPSESHGLGASFLKQFLLRALRERASPQLMSELSSSSFPYARVRREEDYVDLLIVDEYLRFVVIVENKIDAPEHGDQLEKYWISIHQKFPRLKLFGVLLSPNSRKPSHSRYSAFSYAELAEILQREAAAAGIKPEAGVIIRHYIETLRSEFMDNPLGADLAWDMWQKRPQVMDFINNNRPTTQITTILNGLLNSERCDLEKLRRGREGPKKLAFVLKGWRKIRQFQDLHPEARYQSALLFWFDVGEKKVRLRLGGREEQPGLTQYLEKVFRSNPIFASHRITHEHGWMLLWSKQFLSEEDLSKKKREDVVLQLRIRWSEFWQKDVPKIERAIREPF